MSRYNRVKTVAFVGVLGALSCVLMLLRFPLPFVPSFYEFDIAELTALEEQYEKSQSSLNEQVDELRGKIAEMGQHRENFLGIIIFYIFNCVLVVWLYYIHVMKIH